MYHSTGNIIGHIRKAREIGYKGHNSYIWHACERCGKERWEVLKKGGPGKKLCKHCGMIGHVISEETRQKIIEGNTAERNWNWKGGRYVLPSGYVRVRLSENDFFPRWRANWLDIMFLNTAL